MVNPYDNQCFFRVDQAILKNINLFEHGSQEFQFMQPFMGLVVEVKQTNKSLFKKLIKYFRLSFKREKHQMKETHSESCFSKVVKPDFRPLFTDALSDVRKMCFFQYAFNVMFFKRLNKAPSNLGYLDSPQAL